MSSLGDYKEIKLEQDGPIAILTLHRPEKMNAFTGKMMQEMIDAFDKTDANDEIRAVIVTGAGRGFCAGADLGSGSDTFNYEEREDRAEMVQGDDISRIRDGGGRLTLRIFECLKPVIAAINGPAIGVGLTLTLSMDFLVAHPQAKLSVRFVKMGVVPELASSHYLVQRCGWGAASDLVLSGRTVLGAEAGDLGLVDEVADDVHLLRTHELFYKMKNYQKKLVNHIQKKFPYHFLMIIINIFN